MVVFTAIGDIYCRADYRSDDARRDVGRAMFVSSLHGNKTLTVSFQERGIEHLRIYCIAR